MGDIDDSGKNPNNVAGGLKAYVHSIVGLHHLADSFSSTTKNPNVSQEAKESAEQRLKEMGQ